MNSGTLRDICHIIQLAPPPSMRFLKEQLQELYTQTAKTHDYTSSIINENGTAEFNIIDQRTPEVTKYVFMGNYITLMHDNINKISLEQFANSVNDIILKAMKELGIPLFVEQRYIIRCHANAHMMEDSRKFIIENVCSIREDKLKGFERPLHGAGLRFVFPPTQNNINEFDVKVESWLRDVRNIYLDNTGRFFQPIQQANINDVKQNLLITRDFIYKNISNFLASFNQ